MELGMADAHLPADLFNQPARFGFFERRRDRLHRTLASLSNMTLLNKREIHASNPICSDMVY